MKTIEQKTNELKLSTTVEQPYTFAVNNRIVDLTNLFKSPYVSSDYLYDRIDSVISSPDSVESKLSLIRCVSELFIDIVDSDFDLCEQTHIAVHNAINDFVNNRIDVSDLLKNLQTAICDEKPTYRKSTLDDLL